MDDRAHLLDDVRAAAAGVAASARFVTIDEDRLDSYLATIPVDDAVDPALDPGDLPTGDEDATLAWVLTVNAVNFGSGFFPVLRKRPGLSGSLTIFAGLRDRFDRDGPLTLDELRAADVSTCAAVFGQDADGPVAELLGWFAEAWRELGEVLAERWGGSFRALVEDAAGSAERLATLLAGLPGWRDVGEHEGRAVPLYKRAQITPAHLAMAFGGDGPGRFGDLGRLTIFADNLVPHVLRVDGVLRHDPDLADRIASEELIAAGSVEEVEIRAVALHAVERLGDRLRTAGHPVTSMGLDQVLWHRGGAPRYKAIPRHRTRTRAY